MNAWMFDLKGTHELGNASIAASPHRNHYIQFFCAQMPLVHINADDVCSMTGIRKQCLIKC